MSTKVEIVAEKKYTYIITFCKRECTSDYEEPTIWHEEVANIEDARTCQLKNFNNYLENNNYPECWDSEDMRISESDDNPAPVASMKLAEDLFSVSNIQNVLASGRIGIYGRILYDPYSISGGWIMFEIFIRKVKA